jgi:hypothetical protein
MRTLLPTLVVLLGLTGCTEGAPAGALAPTEAHLARGASRPKLEGVFNTQLRAENERPHVSTSTAKGSAQIKVYSNGEIEWKVQVNNQNGEAFTMGHIHRINNTEARTGPPVVWLFPSAPPPLPADQAISARKLDFRGSVINATIAEQILAQPELFYVNLHTVAIGAGAILGDLAK